MINVELRPGAKLFFDDIHFPRGFNRSGEFTISESKLLNEYGDTMRRLADGTLAPINEDEKRFVRCTGGEQEATTFSEKTWKRYQNAILPKVFMSFHNGGIQPFEMDSSEYTLEL